MNCTFKIERALKKTLDFQDQRFHVLLFSIAKLLEGLRYLKANKQLQYTINSFSSDVVICEIKCTCFLNSYHG